MTTNSISSFLPNIVVKPMSDNLWEEMSFIPVLSSVKAVATLALACIHGLFATFRGSMTAALLLKGYIFDDGFATMSGNLLLFNTLLSTAAALNLFVVGILEAIPVVGNLSLAFLVGRIQINPTVQTI